MNNLGENITANRISQIRNVLENTNQNAIEEMTSDVDDRIRAIILAAYPQGLKNNEHQIQQLRNFINNFVSGMREDEYIDLVNRIEFYEDEYEKCSGDMEEDFIALENTQYQPLNKRLERLLTHGCLLPVTKDDNKFNQEMTLLVANLAKRIEKEAKKSGFAINYLEADILLEAISVFGMDTYDISYGEEMLSYLSSINFTISLNELYKTEEGPSRESVNYHDDLNDNLKFEIQCNRYGTTGISKLELIELFESQGYKRDGDNFTLYQNDHIEIKAYLHGVKYEGPVNEEFTLEIYAKRKKDKITSVQFLELSMSKLSFAVERVVAEIYANFGEPRERHVFDIEMFLEKMNADGGDDGDNGGSGVKGLILKGPDISNRSNEGKNEKSKNKLSKTKIESTDIILEDDIMLELDILKNQFNKPDYYKEHSIEPPKGIILYGPPGTGKTLFARKFANETNTEIMIIKPQDILNKWEGGNEQKIYNVFKDATKKVNEGKKVIIFFDEADGLVKQRTEEKNNKGGIISIILQEMDGFDQKSLDNIFIIFTSNRKNAIDSAILDRFDKQIEIGLPSQLKRIELFELYIGKKIESSKHKLFDNLDHEKLAKTTKGKSGRFIKKLINNAVLHFAHSKLKDPETKLITTQDILDGIKLVEKEDKTKNSIGFGAEIGKKSKKD